MNERATVETMELQPQLPLEWPSPSWDVLVTPTEDPPELPFFVELRKAPLANKIRFAVALGAVGLTTTGAVMIGVHLQTQDEDAGRSAAALSAAQLSSCLDYVQNITGPEPKIIIAERIPTTIQDDCGISQKLEDAKNADQARGMPAAQPYEAEIVDTSGATVKLPSEASLKDKIAHLEVAANDYNPAMRIFLGSLSAFCGLVVGLAGVGYISEKTHRARLKRCETEMKTRSDYR